MPQISVIVPVYNVEQYLEKCVDSILSQTFTDFELILVDDGSPDNCGRICDTYARDDNRIKVIHQENAGLSAARNSGIDASVGKYIVFVDSDDYIEKDMLECLYNAIETNQADLAICSVNCVQDNPSVDMSSFKNEYNPIKDETWTGREILSKKMFERESWIWVVAWNKMYRRELFNDLRFPIGKIHEDEFMVHKIMLKCNQVIGVPQTSYNYLIRESGITGQSKNVKRLDCVEALFERSIYYSSEIDFELKAKEMLEQGVRAFQNYYYAVGRKNDKAHSLRNREIQQIYREAFSAIRKNNIHMEFCFYENWFGLYGTWLAYIAREKIKRIMKINERV